MIERETLIIDSHNNVYTGVFEKKRQRISIIYGETFETKDFNNQ